MPSQRQFRTRGDKNCSVRTICSESLNGSGRAKSAGICNAHDRDQDYSVENRGKSFDAGKLNGNDEW